MNSKIIKCINNLSCVKWYATIAPKQGKKLNLECTFVFNSGRWDN